MLDIDFGTITKVELKLNQEGDSARFVQCQVTADQDAQLVELITPPGDDSSPPIGASVLIIDIGGRRVGFLLNAGIALDSQSEEKAIYGSSGGAKTSFLKLKPNGTIEINGFSDFAVRFNALQTIMIVAVQTAINTQLGLISTEINNLGGDYTPTPLNIDLSTARVDNVKLP